jgi:20S proteasome alpha/beta subunit
MTLIVGILCSDGVVMAADGAATYGAIGQQTIRQPVKKLEIARKDTIVGVSGPIGTAQRYYGEIQRMPAFKGNDQPDQAMQKIRAAILPIVKDEFDMAQRATPVIGNAIAAAPAIASAMVATMVQTSAHLFQFNWQASPEAASPHLPFVAIGSGQPIADPFLAFIRRLFWPDKLPPTQQGVFAALWAVRHAIQTSPGGVAEPIQVAVLTDGKAREIPLEELQEHHSAIDAAERRCANLLAPAQPEIEPPPTAP